ncbi:hypothetical protein BKA56DRAFT_707560 [Ilyonectria sp. MPI-CAGE-AT-0026]|nr:hypothetical protein BKA56DRAFT_707560 [Ilyonectria sp. MPI-CAGE-AT-0026]
MAAQRSSQPRTVVDTIDLTDESQPPSRNVLSDTSQHAPTSSMAIPTARPRLPSDQLTTAINEGNQSRNQHAQATRKLPKSQPFDLTIFFYTGGYKDISQGLLQSKKYQAGSPYLAYKVTHCFVTDPARRYESHADFVNSLVRLATTDGNFVRLDWELISSCQSNTPSSIASFPHEIYNTTSLIEFLHATHTKIASPFKFTLFFLYSYEVTSDSEDPFTPASTRTARGKTTHALSSSPTKQPKPSQSKAKRTTAKRKRTLSMQPGQSEDIKVAFDIKQEPSFKFEEDFAEEEIFVQDDPGFRIEDLIGEGSGDNVGVSKTEDTIKAQTSAEGAKVPEFTMVTRQRTQIRRSPDP